MTATVLLRALVVGALVSAVAVGAWAGPQIHAYYFDAPGCPHCAEAERIVEEHISADPQVRLRVVDVHEPSGLEIGHALLTVAGVGPDVLPVAPGLLVGETYVDVSGFTKAAVLAAVEDHRATGAPDIYQRAERIRGQARHALSGRFRRWGVLTIIGAGLLDGINPCAFATLIFFLTYLGVAGAGGRRLLGVGLLFTLGVFLAYFAFGAGILHAVLALDSFPAIRRVLYILIGAACLAFAGLSVHDFRQIRGGNLRAVKLQLPTAIKRRTHDAIRRGLSARLIAPAALLAGACVSALEIACTGQVYVPAIIYMSSLSETRTIALAWLLLYDALFVTPLLALLGLTLMGASSKRLAQFAQSQAASTKLYMAIFFVLCAAFFLLRAASGP